MPKSKFYIIPSEPTARSQIPNNLPLQYTRLVGREHDVEVVCGILRESDVRLLTLVGPGGVGKTRVALEIAKEILGNGPYSHGIYLVDLSPVTDPQLVLPAVATVLGLRDVPGTSIESKIKEHLRDKRMLLVLDNFEQVVECGVALADVLDDCSDLTLLVTSRAPLRLHAEHEYTVAPLALPEPKQQVSLHSLSGFGAVELFVQRASAVKAGFKLTADNASSVVEICRKVDGLPLAIELVAAHSKLLTPQSILARLTNPLRLLAGGSRESPARHRTIRNTIEWSYNLLDEEEQRLFNCLSVFVGGFSLRAAEAVCNKQGDIAIRSDHPYAIDVLEGLEELVDKNLVRQFQPEEDSDPRMTMLDTVREYSKEQLAASPEAESIHRRHADYFIAMAEHIASLKDEAQKEIELAQLIPDLDNLRAVLHRLLKRQETAESEDGLKLLRALYSFWEDHLHVTELREWFDLALARAGAQPTPLRAWSLQQAAGLARWQGDFGRAVALGEEALAMAKGLGDPIEIANALNSLGGVALYRNDYETARARSEEALSIYREVGASRAIYMTLGNLGLAATYQGDYRRAEELLTESVRLHHEAGEIGGSLRARTNLGYVVYYQGDPLRARAIFLETLGLTIKIDSHLSSARLLAGIACTILAEIDIQPRTDAQNLKRVALAARLLGLASARRERGGGNFDPRSQEAFERSTTTARERLREVAFTAEWEEGRGLTLEQAFELAIQDHARGETNVAQAKGRGRPMRRAAGGLTAREYDVAVLVARGLTNPEVAEQLVLSVRTVETHVANAMQKLGLHTRTELAVWAVSHNPTLDSEANYPSSVL